MMTVDDRHLRQVGEIAFGSGQMYGREKVCCVLCVVSVRGSEGEWRDRKGGNGWRSAVPFFFGPLSHPHAPLLSPPLCLSAHPTSFSPTRSPPRKHKEGGGGLSLPACHSPIPTTNIVCPGTTATLSSLLGTPVCSWSGHMSLVFQHEDTHMSDSCRLKFGSL
jgi:hypothetical protein